MDVLQKTRQTRERQRTIQLAVISKLKTLQKRRAMLKVCVQKWLQRDRRAVRITRLNTRIGEARKRRREQIFAREPQVHEKPVYVRGKRAVARGV
jgi:hypothetical protein